MKGQNALLCAKCGRPIVAKWYVVRESAMAPSDRALATSYRLSINHAAICSAVSR